MNARQRITDLEHRAVFQACEMCRDGSRPVVTFPADLMPSGPVFCEQCGRELLHVVVSYVDGIGGLERL